MGISIAISASCIISFDTPVISFPTTRQRGKSSSFNWKYGLLSAANSRTQIFIFSFFQPRDDLHRVFMEFPWNGCSGSECRFVDFFSWRMGSKANKEKLFNKCSVGTSEYRPYIIQASDIVHYCVKRQSGTGGYFHQRRPFQRNFFMCQFSHGTSKVNGKSF